MEQTLMRAARCAAFLLLVADSGCALVTNLDTSGYEAMDAGRAHDSACNADICLDFECLGASDCPSGWVCCLDVSSAASAGFSCKMGPECGGVFPVQLCRTDSECAGGDASEGDGGSTCIHQQCSLGGVTSEFEACGNVPGCSL